MKTNRILSWVLVLVMTAIVIPQNAWAYSGDVRTVLQSQTTENSNQSSGIVYEKTAAAMSDGTVDITLSAYTTGAVVEGSVIPTDIVLVIDTSGSMDSEYNSSVITGYEEAYATKYQSNRFGFSDTSVGYYINTGTTEVPVYTKVTYANRDSNSFQYFSYSGNYVYPQLASSVTTSKTRQYSYDVKQFYTAVTETSSGSRMTVLKEAVNSFIDVTATNNVGLETENMHNISIVKFAGEKYSNDTTDTPVLTEGNSTYVSDGYTFNYSQVIKNLTPVDEAGVTELKNAINGLVPYGSTAVDKGLELARLVLDSRTPSGDEERSKVVIVFTDGEPNYYSGFDSAVANNAIATAYNMKTEGDVSIFGVSVAPNADATDLSENINKFMHYVSSNYPDATNMSTAGAGGSISGGHYMTPSSDTSLTNIFEKIGEEIDARHIELGTSAKMADTISAYFDFASTNASNFKLQTSARKQNGTWSAPVTDTNLSYTISGDKITVEGFDYDANFVSAEGRGDGNDFYGKKLVVSFTVIPDYTVIDPAYPILVGGVVPTNSGNAVVLNSNQESVAQVAPPELVMKNITYRVDGEIYKQYYRFPGADKTVDAEPTKTGYTFSGWNYPSGISVSEGAFTMPNQDVEITGTFVANTYNVTYQYSTAPPEGAPELPASHTAGYGSVVTVATPAQLQGYTFVGWYPLQTDVTVTEGQFTMPAKNVTLAGYFESVTTTPYKVEHYMETLEDGVYETTPEVTQYYYGTTGNTVEATPLDGITGFAYNETISTPTASGQIAGDGGLTLKLYYDREEYTVTYSYDGDTDIDGLPALPSGVTYKYGQTVTVNDRAIAPAGYTFVGWYKDTVDNVVDGTYTMPDYNVLLRGYFTPNSGIQYKVEHYLMDLNGEYPLMPEITENFTGTTGHNVFATPLDIFTGFSYNETISTPTASGQIAGDGGLTLKLYYDRKTYNVIYDYEGDVPSNAPELPDGGAYVYGAQVTAAADVTPPLGYAFSGWYLGTADNPACGTFVMPNHDIHILGQFVKNTDTPYRVEHYLQNEECDGYILDGVSELRHGTTDTVVSALPKEYPGFTYNDGISTPGGTVAGDGTLVLKFHYDRNSYNVTYVYEGIVPDNAPEAPNQTDNIFGTEVTVEPVPEVSGYIFEGWTTGDATVVNNKFCMPHHNVAFTGHFIKEHTVSYDFNGGTGAQNVDYTTVIVPDGTEVTVKATPKRAGYVFQGWKETENTYAQGDKVLVNKDIVFVAQWLRITGSTSAVPTFEIKYENNGGSSFDNETFTSGALIDIDKVPVKEGYIFGGWYIDGTLVESADEIKVNKNITVSAEWIKDNGLAGNGHPTPWMLNGDDHYAYVIGYPDGMVKPSADISRAEVATIFFRLLKSDVRDGNIADNNSFADINSADWHNKAISTMEKLGIVSGRTENMFAPDESITRAEFATICARFDDSEYKVSDDFTDVKGHWAEEYIKEAAAHGWIRGYNDGTFKPDQLITRAEAMTTINRVLNRVPETDDDLTDDMVKWPDNNDKAVWYYLAVQEATNSHDYEKQNIIYGKWINVKDGDDWLMYQ